MFFYRQRYFYFLSPGRFQVFMCYESLYPFFWEREEPDSSLFGVIDPEMIVFGQKFVSQFPPGINDLKGIGI